MAELAQDATLQSVAQSMCKALSAYHQKRGVHHGVASNWSFFFAEVDVDGSGRLTFEEFDGAVRGRLGAAVSRYELRLFWRRADADGSGLVTLREFARLMYRIEVSAWPDLPEASIGRCVSKLNAAAEKWHHCGGNWGKIFRQMDTDDSGQMTYDELRRCVRGSPPGLQLKAKDVSEEDLQGLWKALDRDGNMDISVGCFTGFMRRHGAAYAMHRLTKYSKKKRGLEEIVSGLAQAPERTPDELRETVRQIDQALQAFWADRGLHAHAQSRESTWARFYDEVDIDKSGRLTFSEFTAAIISKLGRLWALCRDDGVDAARAELLALWGYMDPDGSGEVTEKEFAQGVYKLELEVWPEADDAMLRHAVGEINAAAEKWHRAAGNWYKVFNLVDPENSGHLGFDDLSRLVRGRYPALDIAVSRVPESDLRAFWKALDSNRSGDTTVKEFMLFMRKHGSQHSMHRVTKYSQKKRGLGGGERDIAGELSMAPDLDRDGLRDVADRLCQALNSWLLVRGITGAARAGPKMTPRIWDELFEFIDFDRSGRLKFVEFEAAVRDVLRATDRISTNEVRAFWRLVDGDGSGEATMAEFANTAYRLQLETWPALEPDDLARLVSVFNAAADKWHRCGGNWYKVFSRADEDGSGEMAYDEMVSFVRKKFPGLSVGPKDVSDVDLQGIWRALDADGSGKVTTKEFMAFMRRHGAQHSFHRLTSYSQEKRGLVAEKERPGTPPEKNREELQNTARLLDKALTLYWTRRGVHVNMKGSWRRLFEDADSDGSGRLTFFELERSLRERLLSPKDTQIDGLVAKGVMQGDLLALWALVDADGSGEVTAKEWQLYLYRLELEAWPAAEPSELSRIVDTLHEAAHKWHGAGGNWYKVFSLIDADTSGKLGFEEMREVVRRRLPCLAIPAERLPERDLQALWKVLDADSSGEVTISEFMRFMRRHGTKRQLHDKWIRVLPDTAQASLAKSQQGFLEGPGALSDEQVDLLRDAFGDLSEESLAAEYERKGVPWSGVVSEWDLLGIIRNMLGISEDQLDDDGVYAAWKFLDKSGAGRVDVHALFAFGERDA